MDKNFFCIINDAASSARDKVFLETPDRGIYRYADLEDTTARYANLLETLGVQPGDRVAVQAEKSPECFLLYLAVMRMGGIYLPLNVSYTQSEIAFFLEDAAPVLFVGSTQAIKNNNTAITTCVKYGSQTLEANGTGSFINEAAQKASEHRIATKESTDVAIIMYTSGTTGKPKGAMLTHGNLDSNAQALTALWQFTAEDVLLHALPIFHAHGLFISSHCALLSQSKIIYLDKFDTDTVIDYLPQSTVMMGVPTFYTRLLNSPRFTKEAAKNIRLFISGSAPLLEETSKKFTQVTGQVILERYGMTESAIIASNPYDGERKVGSVGRSIEGVEIRICDDDNNPLPADTIGHVQITGPAIMKGYWQNEQKTKEEFTPDGWFKTGDNGYLDADDYLYIVGRSKDMVISGGYNVYPKEIETVIDGVDGVLESAIIGLPHDDFGEAVTAVVVKEQGAEISQEIIVNATKGILANYKTPKAVIFLESLPRNTMGKVLKSELRQAYSDLYRNTKQ